MTGGSKGSHGREGAPQRSILSSLPGNGGTPRRKERGTGYPGDMAVAVSRGTGYLGDVAVAVSRSTGYPGDVAVAVSRSCWPGAVLFPHACPFPCSLSGIIGERLPIRYYLTFGMLASGAFTALFGLGYFYNIHSLGFYVVTQVRACSRFTVRTGTVRVPKQELGRGAEQRSSARPRSRLQLLA